MNIAVVSVMDLASLLISYTQWAETAVGAYGYLGIFLVSVIGNASIIFPIPVFILIFTMGAVLNPWLVGLAGGLGAALGETTGYLLGAGGRKAVKKKYKKSLQQVRAWAKKRSIFLLIVLFAATPLPSDIIGVFAGLIKYNFKKFMLANLIGKLAQYIIVAWAGAFSFDAVLLLIGG